MYTDFMNSISELRADHPLLSDFLSCVTILIICAIAWRLGTRIIGGIFERAKKSKKLHMTEQQIKKVDTTRTISQSIFKYLVFIVWTLVTLQVFDVPVGSLLAVAGVGGIAIGIGAQSLVKDILNGIFILFENQFSVGDIIKISDMVGTVEDFNFRTTRIRSFDGDLHIIPNGEIRFVTNRSIGFRRVVLDVDICYEEDADKVIGIIGEELKKAEGEIGEITGGGKVLGVSALSEHSVTIKFCVDCELGTNTTVERELLKRVHDRFKQEGVRLPPPCLVR